jgi:hypothetical protein
MKIHVFWFVLSCRVVRGTNAFKERIAFVCILLLYLEDGEGSSETSAHVYKPTQFHYQEYGTISSIFRLFSLFKKIKVGLRDHLPACVCVCVCVCVCLSLPINSWVPEPFFMNNLIRISRHSTPSQQRISKILPISNTNITASQIHEAKL